jgi:hypothetical protein
MTRTLPLAFCLGLLAGCNAAEKPQAAPGSMERFVAQHDRDEAAAKVEAYKAADVRAAAQATADIKAADEQEKKRVEARE